jgi:hypothetical protein
LLKRNDNPCHSVSKFNDETKEQIADMLLTVLQMMADLPDEVSVETVETHHGVLFRLKVLRDQTMLVIGQQKTELFWLQVDVFATDAYFGVVHGTLSGIE